MWTTEQKHHTPATPLISWIYLLSAWTMFERFTEKAIKVIMLAQEEARRLGQRGMVQDETREAPLLRP